MKIKLNNFSQMFLLYYLAIFITLTQNVAAQDIQTLEEINAELLKKKQDLEPFNDKDIKVDLESLGLDDVNKKDKKNNEEVLKLPTLDPIEGQTFEEDPNKNSDKDSSIISKIKNIIGSDVKKPEDKSVNKTQPKPEVKSVIKQEQKPEQKPEEKPQVKEVIKVDEKIDNKNIVKTEEVLPKIDESKPNSPESAKILESIGNNIIPAPIVDSSKEKNIELEIKPIIQNEKLQKLRDKYLIKIHDRKNDLENKESNIILPQRKTINPFISEDLPAVPILNSYRTVENAHIPIFLSYEERVNHLFDAVSFDDVAFFNSAYQNVKNPNIKNEVGDTILTYSMLLGRHDIMISIINKGANADLPNHLGYRPLDIAIELLDFKAFELLVNNNADINHLDLFGRSYLTQASRVGFLSAVKVLIQKGLDVNLVDKEGLTPLTVAYRNNRELVARYLLKNGAKNQDNIEFNQPSKSVIKELENRWK